MEDKRINENPAVQNGTEAGEEDTFEIDYVGERHHHHHHSHHETDRERAKRRTKEDNVYYDKNGKEHVKRRRSSVEYRHHYHHHKHGWKRVLIVLAAVLLFVVVAAVVSWRVLDEMGRKALYQQAEAAAPTLTMEETTDEATAGAEETGKWQAGWVRYNGKVYEYNSDIITFLIMGIDDKHYVSKKTGYRNGGQADALFFLVMNPDTKQISIVAINRNTMTDFDTFDENGEFEYRGHGQICLAYEYGDGMEKSCENEENAVRDLFFSLPVSGYVSINMGAIPTINDELGGVTVPQMSFDNGEITYGEDVTLFGQDAYDYVHYRDTKVFDTASFRLEKQKVYLKAMMKKTLAAVKENPMIVVNLYQDIVPYMVTDVGLSEVTYLADNMAGYSFNSDIYSLKGTTTMGDDGYEQFNYDEDALRELMINVFYNEVEDAE